MTRDSHASPIFDQIERMNAEQIVFGHDPATGLRSLIVIHDTTLGPSLGGVRMWSYESESEAIEDGLKLARAMTMKAAAAGLNLGGSASLIIGDAATDKSEALLRAHGRFIATLGGRFIAVNDVGTDQADMGIIAQEASPVCDTGDPSPFTALGVIEAMRACFRILGESGNLEGKRVAVQGAGNVGSHLTRLLRAESVDVVLSDVVPSRALTVAERYDAQVVDPEALLSEECDVFAPCALGGVLTVETITMLRCRVVAGGANNVLSEPGLIAALDAAGILYAPDFLANAGGLIYLEEKLLLHDDERASVRVRSVGSLLEDVLRRASRDGVTSTQAAVAAAEQRIAARRAYPPYVA